MKAYRGNVGTAPLSLYLDTERVRVVSFAPPLLFPNLPYLYSTNAACFIIQNSALSKAPFLNLGSAKSCLGPRETKMRNGGTVSFAVPKFYVQLIFRVTLIIPSLIAHRQSIAASAQKLPDSIVKLDSRSRHENIPCVRRNHQVIEQFDVSRQ